MITKETKISKMLEAYPQTLAVLLQASSHFEKLNNKFLRKTVARRVSVEQAAGVAEVSVNQLLTALNEAVGEKEVFEIQMQSNNHNIQANTTKNDKPEFLNGISPDKIITLDVREDISTGVDPFKKIMSTIKNLSDDLVLHLINTFEPVPLYSVLGNRGYEHWTENNNNVWEIFFYKNNSSGNNNSISKFEDNNLELNGEENIIELNVRELPPPEPMMKILEILPNVDENTLLLVLHHREPMMLYEKLEERGYRAVTNKVEENYYKVIITKKKDLGKD